MFNYYSPPCECSLQHPPNGTICLPAGNNFTMQMQIPLTAYDTDYSIVICTYNPDERLLKRCLNAIYNLDTDGITAEVILVDNSSLIPLDGLAFVREFIRKMPSLKIIVVA